MELDIDDGAISEIAKKAIARKTGARGLRSIFEKAMQNIMFDIPSREDIVKCVVSADNVVNDTEPKLVIDERAKAKSKERKKENKDKEKEEADAS